MRIFLGVQLGLRMLGDWMLGWFPYKSTNQSPTQHISCRSFFLPMAMIGLLWLMGQATDSSWVSATRAQTVPPAPTPAWTIDPNQNNLAVFIVDYAGDVVKEAYFLQEPSCQTTLPSTTLRLNARSAISNTLTGGQLALALQAGSRLPETTTWFDALFAWSIHLGDFTAQTLLTPCLGQPIFAGESLWMGQGVRPFPRQPLPATALGRLPTQIPPPAVLATVAQTEWMTITAEAAWSTIADLNLLHDLAQQPFAAHAFLYRPATGYIDPLEELDHAEWVFIIYRKPLNRTQILDEYYLPLIHQ